MELSRRFSGCKFSPDTIRKATAILADEIDKIDTEDEKRYQAVVAKVEKRRAAGGSAYVGSGQERRQGNPQFQSLYVSDSSGSWRLDDVAEWWPLYRADDCHSASFEFNGGHYFPGPRLRLSFDGGPAWGSTSVTIESPQRGLILSSMEEFASAESDARVAAPVEEAPEPLRGFMGHGRSQQWRVLRDSLADQHGYRGIEVFESGSRAGHGIRDILEGAASRAEFAILVLTGEDLTDDGQLRARQNVIHEAGLFQGRLGYVRAFLVVEEGLEMMSNLDGVQQIRFPAGQIGAAVGEVLAALRREFDDRR